MDSEINHITVADGIRLAFRQAGAKTSQPMLFIPGWRQTAVGFNEQMKHFSAKYRCITYDHRGHGESDRPSHGHRIPRLSADLKVLIETLDLKDVILVGHSMGCSLIWCLWDVFPEIRSRISKLVLVDQVTYMLRDSDEPNDPILGGAVFGPTDMKAAADAMRGDGDEQFLRQLLGSMFPEDVDKQLFEQAIEQSLGVSGETAASLLVNHARNSWEDVIPRITVPTLVMSAAAGTPFPANTTERIASLIPGAKLRTFAADEGACHFMFQTNPDGFNRAIEDFV